MKAMLVPRRVLITMRRNKVGIRTLLFIGIRHCVHVLSDEIIVLAGSTKPKMICKASGHSVERSEWFSPETDFKQEQAVNDHVRNISEHKSRSQRAPRHPWFSR